MDRWIAALKAEGCLELVEVRAADLDRILLSWQQAGLARETLRGLRASARGFFGWLAKQGKILMDPSLDLDLGAVPNDVLPPDPLNESEITTLIDQIPRRSVKDLRNRAMVELLYGSGLRLSECLNLDLKHLNLRQRTVQIHGKGGHERILPLMNGALTALNDYLALRRNLLSGPDQGHLFIGTNGKRITKVTFQQ